MALTDLELWCMGNPIEAAKRIDVLQCALEAMLVEAGDRDGFSRCGFTPRSKRG